MIKYELNTKFNILIAEAGSYYAETLIDLLNEENEEIKPGWGIVEGISNDWIRYRIILKK